MQNLFRRLAAIELPLVALCIVISVFAEKLLPVTLGVALSFWVVRWVAYGKVGTRTPLDAPIIIILLMLGVSLWATAFPEVTQLHMYRLLISIALYYAVVNWVQGAKAHSSPIGVVELSSSLRTHPLSVVRRLSPFIPHTPRARIQAIVIGMVLLGLVLALMSPISVAWNTGKLPFIPESFYTLMPRLTSFSINSNVIAGQLVVLLPFPFALVLLRRERLGCGLLILSDVALVLMTSILIVTGSRGGLTTLVTIVMIIVTLRWRRGWILALAVPVFGMAIVFWIGYGEILNFFGSSGAIHSAESRFEIWSRAWYMIQDFPFTGIGIGTFKEVYNLLYPMFLSGPDIPHAHNLYLQIAVDFGIPGFVAWAAIMITVIVIAWRIYRHGQVVGDTWMRALGIGLLGSQMAMLMHGITDCVVWTNVRTAPLIWGIWGIAVAAKSLETFHHTTN